MLPAHHLIWCVGFVLALLSVPQATCWSGTNAYTIVLLKDIDTNAELRRAFYDGPAGTVISVALTGYDIARAGAQDSVGLPFSDATASPLHYDRGSGRENTPIRTALSDEWEVLEKPAAGGNSSDSLFLHCRLPLPHSAAEVSARERQLLSRSGPAMQERLSAWWRRFSTQRASGCFYGDGEGVTTGVSRFYEVCPVDGVYRVLPDYSAIPGAADFSDRDEDATEALEDLEELQEMENELLSDDGEGDSSNASKETSGGFLNTFSEYLLADDNGEGVHVTVTTAKRRDEKKAAAAVLDWLSRVHKSRRAWTAAHGNPAYAAMYEKVGAYHEELSLPKWNTRLRAWEMVYPTTERCSEHFSTVGRAPHRRNSSAHDGGSDGGVRPISPSDAYWKSVIRFRCSPRATATARGSQGRLDLGTEAWTIVEMRQLCRYQLDIDAPLVCAWDHEMDSTSVNPIPCVALN